MFWLINELLFKWKIEKTQLDQTQNLNKVKLFNEAAQFHGH